MDLLMVDYNQLLDPVTFNIFHQRYKDTISFLFNIGSKNQKTHIKSSNTK